MHAGAAKLPGHVVLTSSLSKVIGQHGGFVAGSHAFIEELIGRSSAFKYATPLPPILCRSAIAAISLCKAPERSVLLENNVQMFMNRMGRLLTKAKRSIPVFSFEGVGAVAGATVAQRLLGMGIYVPYLKNYGRASGVLRVALNSSHAESEIIRLCDAFCHLAALEGS